MIFVYAGPTIAHDEIRQHLDCVCLPPVSHGDILRLLPENPDAIGIIDGYFEGVPSVWHKEILYALDQGIHVYGSASMGALRAAELQPFGMQGVGQIFEWYKEAVLTDDDEVAVLHGPAEVGYLVASEPMVNIRASLARALQRQLIDEEQLNGLLAAAKKTFYKERSWKQLMKLSIDLFDDESLSASLSDWLQRNRIDLKKQDALQMLQTMHRNRADFSTKAETRYHFEWTSLWDKAFYEQQKSILPDDDDRSVLDQLRLQPDRYQRYRDKALLGWICQHAPNTRAGDRDVKTALKQFRAENQLDSRAQMLAYMSRVGLDETRLTALLQRAARVNQVRDEAADLGPGIIEQLKLDGHYLDLLDTAGRKRARLESAGQDADHAELLPPQLLAWYFKQQLGGEIPRRLEDHLRRIDLDNSDDFYRLIAADYLYWLETDR